VTADLLGSAGARARVSGLSWCSLCSCRALDFAGRRSITLGGRRRGDASDSIPYFCWRCRVATAESEKDDFVGSCLSPRRGHFYSAAVKDR